MTQASKNRMITKAIVQRLASEFAAGKHQRQIDSLPAELQFRLDCSWGRALTFANDIRVGKVKLQ